MNPTLTLWDKVTGLIEAWEQLAVDLSQNTTVTEHDRGFAEGLAAASSELRILLAQLNGLPVPSPYELDNGDIEMDFRSDPNPLSPEPEWEYLYITFEQTANGDWMLKDMNGLWLPEWGNAPSFDQAVEQLRHRQGWRLVSFAKGIHVFRRSRRL